MQSGDQQSHECSRDGERCNWTHFPAATLPDMRQPFKGGLLLEATEKGHLGKKAGEGNSMLVWLLENKSLRAENSQWMTKHAHHNQSVKGITESWIEVFSVAWGPDVFLKDHPTQPFPEKSAFHHKHTQCPGLKTSVVSLECYKLPCF